VITLQYRANITVYTQQGLVGCLAAQGGVVAQALTFLYDIVTANYSGPGWQLDNARINIESNTTTTAGSVATNLVSIIAANPNVCSYVGVYFSFAQYTSSCDASGCSCNGGYSGQDCDVLGVCPNNCSGNGNCTTGQFGPTCQCNQNWSGRDCSTPLCPNSCSGRGSCVIEGNTTECQCQQYWTGIDCSTPTGAGCPNNCSYIGDCVDGVCQCADGRIGDDCGQEFLVSSSGPSRQPSTTSPGLIAAIVIVSVIVAILIVVIAVMVYRRRRRADGILRFA